MPRRGKGTAGDSVGSASVEIAAEIVITNEDEVAQVAAQAASEGKGSGRGRARDVAGSGRDAAPRSANVDAKVKTKLDGNIRNDVQAALNKDEFQITLDTASIRRQVEMALQRPFEITLNAEVAGSQRVAGVGATPSQSVAMGAPANRGPTPQEIVSLMTREGKKGGREQQPFVGGINEAYRAINEMLKGAGRPRFGAQPLDVGNEIEKATEMIEAFGDQVDDWFRVSGRKGSLTGGTIVDFLKAEGVTGFKGSALEANVGAFAGDNRRSQDLFFTRLSNWIRDSPLQAQPAAAPEQTANAVMQAIKTIPNLAAEERVSAASAAGVEVERAEQAAAQRDIRVAPVDLSRLPTSPRATVARDRREDDPEAEARARQQLGGRNRANVRRLRGRGAMGRLSTVGAGAGTEIDLEPFLRLAEMGGFENIWEQFTGKKFNESQGLFQFSPTDPDSLGELGRLSKLRPGPKRQIAGQEGKFARVMPTEALIRSVAQSVMPPGATEVPGETMDEVRAFVESNIEDVRKAIGQGQSPLQGVRETRRGQGGTQMVASGDLGRRIQKFDEWISFLDDRIEQTSSFIDRVNTAIGRASKRRDTRKVQELEEVSRQASVELQRYDAGLAQAIEDRKEISEAFGEGGTTPEQARTNAAAQALRGAENRERIARGEGLTPEQRATKGFKASGGTRMRDVLMAMGFPERQTEGGPVVGTEIVNALTQRFLEDPNRVTPTGDLRTGTQQMRQVAFGPRGRAGRGAQAGGMLGELMGMLPADIGRTQKGEIREVLTSFLQDVVGNEGFIRGLLEEDVKRKDNMARLRPITGNAERGEIFHGLTGEGQFRFAPGQQAALEADISTNRARAARISELEGILRPSRETIRPAGPGRTTESGEQLRVKEVAKTIYNPDRRYSSENVAKMIQELDVLKGEFKDPDVLQKKLDESLARQQIEASELATSQQTRIKTLGRGRTLTGEQSRDIAREMGVTMEEEVKEPPFAAFAERYAGPARATGVGGGTGGGGEGRGRVPPGGEEGGGWDITGPIHVIVDNVPLQVAFAQGTSYAGATPAQQGIAARSRATWAMADLGEQTSPEFQDEIRRFSERMVGEGMSANDVKKMLEKEGVRAGAAMYYGRGPRGPEEPPAPPAGEEEPRRRELRRKNIRTRDVGTVADTGRIYTYEPGEDPDEVAARRRERERMASVARPPSAAERDFLSALQYVNDPARGRSEQAAERRRLREMRRTAKISDPLGLGQFQDISDEEFGGVRARLRSVQRRVPRRGFGPSIIDLVTSALGGSAYEGQLESVGLAEREAAELGTLSRQRDVRRTQRTGLLRQARVEQDPERRSALVSQAREVNRELVGLGKAIRLSTDRFNFHAEAAGRAGTVLKSFGAAAAGSVVSTGIGAFTFGLGSAIVAPIITAVAEGVAQGVGPALERAGGFAATTARTTLAAAEEIRARGGDTGAVAGIAARTGISAQAFQGIGGDLITRRAEVEAGNLALRDQVDLLRAAQNLRRDQRPGGDAGLFGQTGGVSALGMRFFGVPGTSEILRGQLDAFPTRTTTGELNAADELQRRIDAGEFGASGRARFAAETNVQRLRGQGQGEISPDAIREANENLLLFNEALEKGGSSMRLFIDDTGEATKVAAAAARALNDPELARAFERSNVGIRGLRTPQDLASALAAANRGANTPDVRLLLESTARERRARAEMRQANLQFAQGQIPIQQAMQFAQRPFSDASAGIVFGQGDRASTQKALNAELGTTQKLYNQINAEVKVGFQQARDFVEFGADIFGTGDLVGGLGKEAADQFAGALNNVYKIGKDIAAIEIGLQTKQAAYQAAQFSYQINIAKRSLADAKGLAGQLTDASKDNLGVLERQTFLLQRRAQAMQMELNQRQINFQRAVAGFTAPGLTGEERAARIEQAKIEADYAQRQLNIQKELFGLQGRSFQITASRQVTDLTQQLGLLEKGRVITLDTTAAEKKIRALTFLQEKENAKVQAFYQAAVAATNDIAGDIQQIAVASGKLMTSVANDVIKETVRVLNEITSRVNTITRRDNPGTTPDQGTWGGGRHAGGHAMEGMSYWVGEQGKELVTFGNNAYITPGAQATAGSNITPMNGAGESPINITIMVTGNNVTSEDELAKLEERIFQAVERATSRKISLLGGRSY